MMKLPKTISSFFLLTFTITLFPFTSYSGKSIDHKTWYGLTDLNAAMHTKKVGFHDIVISKDTYFVAALGKKKTKLQDLKEIWETRSAERCKDKGFHFFVKLEYLFEQVLQGDPSVVHPPALRGHVMNTSGTVYIPMIIPSSRSGPVYASSPIYQSHARCIADPTLLLDPSRLIQVKSVIDRAVEYKWIKKAN
ncbi:MAG: hypothetical protein K9M17_06970 [Mariprofundaceae bacterium]|nr:hypothetical protein [Mariprofundaceae bacterium]